MNTKTNDIVVYITGEFDFDNEIILQSSENEDQKFSSSEISTLDESDIKMVADMAKTLIQEEKYDEFGQLIQKLDREGKFRRLMGNEDFLVMFLRYKLHQGHYQDIFHILENVQNTSDPVFIDIWDEAHYRHYCVQQGGTLTSIHKFRIRQRNPPPPGICPGGVRPPARITEGSVSVLREWYSAHSADPYPCKKAKLALAKRAGIPLTKVTNWFSNARRKHKKGLQKLNWADQVKGAVTDKSQAQKDGKTVKFVDKSVGTEELEIANTSVPECYKIHDKTVVNLGENCTTYMANKNNHWSDHLQTWILNLPNIMACENARQMPFSESSLNDENLRNVPKWGTDSPAAMYTVHKQNGSSTVGFSDSLTPNKRVPFSELPRSDNGQCMYEKIALFGAELPKSVERNDKTQYKDVNKGYTPGTFHNPIYKQLPDGNTVNHVFQTPTVLGCKNQIVNQVNQNSENPTVNKEENITVKAKENVYDYKQILPKLKSDEKHSETKIKDIKSVWKLRVKPIEKQREQKEITGLKEEKQVGVRKTASDCLKSLQKLCENVESSVESPIDYARSVEFETCKDETEEKAIVDAHCVNDNTRNTMNFVYDSNLNMKTTREKIENCAKQSFDKGTREGHVMSWADNVIPYSSFPRPAWSGGVQTYTWLLPETAIDLSTGCRDGLNDVRAGDSMAFGNHQHFLQRDQVVPSSLNVFNNNYQSAVAGNQCTGIPGTDWENTWQSWYSHSNQDAMSRSLLETSNLDDYHGIVRNPDGYGTVVGEAIQGLLNLSSSQESDCSCLD